MDMAGFVYWKLASMMFFSSVIITPCGIFKDHVNAPSTYTDHVLTNIIDIVLRKGFINNGFFKPIRYKLH